MGHLGSYADITLPYHLYTWIERGTARVSCLAQEHNLMSLTSTQTWTAQVVQMYSIVYMWGQLDKNV